jgi:glycosyltransferase involved in cell wall biosynthesis
MKTICLAMIVKNESAVIRRALESVKPWIDSWVICDTGSTDGTEEIVFETMQGIAGGLHHVPWVDFGTNRAQAVKLASERADYVLIMDADMVLNVKDPAFKEKLCADAYDLRYEGALDYVQTMLVSSQHDWVYTGVTHEYIWSPSATIETKLFPGISLTHLCDGGMRADKFERDICLLIQAVLKAPGNSRNIFYLAQSYKDLGLASEAFYWYGRRAEMGGFAEESWYAMYQQAKMSVLLKQDWQESLTLFMKAFQYRPTRIEPIYDVVCHYRELNDPRTAFLFAAHWGHHFPYPQDRLFIDATIYKYLMPYEFAFAAASIGQIGLADQALVQLERDARDVPWMQPWIQILKDKMLWNAA